MNKWLKKQKTLRNLQIASFWGPVAVVLAAICFFNAFIINEKSISFEPWNGRVNFIAAIVFFIIGLIFALFAWDKTAFARVGLTVGLSAVFWGSHVVTTDRAGLGMGIGWVVIFVGIISLIVGYKLSPK